MFVLAGMPRAGTTYLYHVLAAHPGFHVTSRKELRYFSHHFGRGESWYASQFRGATPPAIWADLSPDYFMHPLAFRRLADHSARPRVALAIRDPAKWAVSLHRHLRSFEPNVPDFPKFLENCQYPDFHWPGRRRNQASFSLLDGFIRERINCFQGALGSRLLLYDFTQFERDPLAVLRSIEQFAGATCTIPADHLPTRRINARSSSTARGLLRYWLSREPVSHLFSRFLPTRMVLRLRRHWEEERVPARLVAADQADLELAMTALADDRAFVSALFSEKSARLGDANPLGAF